jgi:hypothetical protein
MLTLPTLLIKKLEEAKPEDLEGLITFGLKDAANNLRAAMSAELAKQEGVEKTYYITAGEIYQAILGIESSNPEASLGYLLVSRSQKNLSDDTFYNSIAHAVHLFKGDSSKYIRGHNAINLIMFEIAVLFKQYKTAINLFEDFKKELGFSPSTIAREYANAAIAYVNTDIKGHDNEAMEIAEKYCFDMRLEEEDKAYIENICAFVGLKAIQKIRKRLGKVYLSEKPNLNRTYDTLIKQFKTICEQREISNDLNITLTTPVRLFLEAYQR